jgi:hypothetical protein
VPSSKLILRSHISPDPHHKYLTTRRRQRRARKGGGTQDLSEKTMVPRTFNVKFPCGTQLIFGSLTFATGEDEDLKMLPPRASTRASRSDFIIGIKQILLRIESLCRELHPHCQDRSGYPDRDIHPSALGRSIEPIVIGIDP